MSLNGKRPTSLLRQAASRKNGAKSKGPITVSGKEKSRRNALRHGLLSSVVVLDDVGARESLMSLIQDLCNDLEPEGRLEQILVEEIALCCWRLGRVLVAESGAVSCNASSALSDLASRNQRLASEVDLDLYHQSDSDGEEHSYQYAAEMARELKKTAAGVRVARNWLGWMLFCVEKDGSYPANYDYRLCTLFADEPAFYRELNAANSKARSSGNRDKNDDVHKGNKSHPNLPLTILRMKIEELEKLHEELVKQEALQAEYLRKSLSLPTGEDADQILRYETTIKRQMYRAIDQLERLQRSRKGEYVPPPVKVGIQKED